MVFYFNLYIIIRFFCLNVYFIFILFKIIVLNLKTMAYYEQLN